MFLLYIILVFLILRFTVTLFNFISNPKLTASGKYHDELVSIVIPPHNNEEDILLLLKSIKTQEYENFEVLMPKPAHTTSTSAIDYLKYDTRFAFIELPSLPSGWTMKNFSNHQLSKHANGRYFLFLDPRSIVSKGLLNNAVNRMKMQRLALLSLLTNQLMYSIGERVVVPLINYLALNMIPLRVIRLFKNSAFAVTGLQFMMFDANNYKSHGWYELIKNEIYGENEIMRMVKSNNGFAEVLLANGYIYSRLYTGFASAVQGLSNNIISHFGSIIALFIYIFLVVLGPVGIAMYMSIELLLFAATLIILSRIMISFMSGQHPLTNILLHPLQIASLVLIAVLSVQKHFTKPIAAKQPNIHL